MLLASRCSECGFLAHDTTRVHSTFEQTQECMVRSCDSSGSGKGPKHEEAHANAKVYHSTETKKPRRELEHLQTFCRISSSQTVHTLIFEVNPILLKDPSRDISAEEFFSERQRKRLERVRVKRRQRRYLLLILLLFRATQNWKTRCLLHQTHLMSQKPIRAWKPTITLQRPVFRSHLLLRHLFLLHSCLDTEFYGKT